MAALEQVLSHIRSRIVPTQRERDKMAKLADRLKLDIERILVESGTNVDVTVQGSYARDTWISHETDLDIFARFPPAMDRKEWVENVLPAIRRGMAGFNVIERYAEHPFLELHVEGIRVNVVPCYNVEKGQWKSATDRTPYHTKFMKTNLNEELRLQARLLKKFTKGIGVYGAEIKVGGFSGMLVDTLTLFYRSFSETLRQASSWTHGTKLEIGKPVSVLDSRKRERIADLVVADPVDPDRNLAAALRKDRLWNFVAAGRQFLLDPGSRYFFPQRYVKKTRNQFLKQMGRNGRELEAIVFKHPFLVPDVLWGQLMRIERNLVELLARAEFETYRSAIWSDEGTQSAVLLEVDRAVLSSSRLQKGPPVAKREDSQSFLQRHGASRDTIRGPWIEADRWMVQKRRNILTVSTLVKASREQKSYGLSIPRQMGDSFSKTVRILEGKAVLTLLGREGFAEALWRFLEAKPQWLKLTRA